MRSFKFVAVGDGAVGKTCAMLSFATNSFPGEYVPTVFDNASANVMHRGQPTNVQLWDTAGQEDYDTLRPLSYPQSDVFLLCFSVISRASLANVAAKWVPELRHYAPGVPIMLVGTKIDLRGDEQVLERLRGRKERPIATEEAQAVCEQLGLDLFCEVSALTQQGLHAMFGHAIDLALAPKKKHASDKHKCSIL